MIPVAVVGGGAAGLMASIAAAREGAETWLLEGTRRMGTKILMSGGTRCNVTHDFVSAADYYGGSRNVVARLLRAFSHEDARRFFVEDLGVPLKREPTGKLFPETDDARTLLEALLAKARELRVVSLLGQKVTAIERIDGGFALTTSADRLEAHSVILTTGGLSHPRTGSDGTGYALAQSLGHSIVFTTPALTPIVGRGELHQRLRGVTLPVELTVWRAGKKFWTGTGSFLFTHFGYSGPVVLDASRHLARESRSASVRITASFLPGLSFEELEAELLDESTREPRRTAKAFLRGKLPESLARELIASAEMPGDEPLPRLSREGRRRFVHALVAFELPVLEVMGYRKAEVTAGGIPLAEVDPATLESRVTPGLFLAGEILDTDGRLGGYNFQWAWSTGHVAGRSAAGPIRRR